ncbi:urease subunit beta [Embleya sp. NBC_00888]|uniref:urease subunit beta n=1 Tax=Embleya sp. NBC_00888 TaxID=2975960 RepID=UPI00386E0BD4|nr:urease subunit beta [Embleya sp. NBC_00888]
MVMVRPQRYLYRDDPAAPAPDRPVLTVSVRNSGAGVIRVGSHYHFAEIDPALVFDRAATFGIRANIAAGTSIRFEPGGTREVELRPFAGTGRLVGCTDLAHGPAAGRPARLKATLRAIEHGLREAHTRAQTGGADPTAPQPADAERPAGPVPATARAGRPPNRPAPRKPGAGPPAKPSPTTRSTRKGTR